MISLMIVEDDDDMRFTLVEAFQERGLFVQAARTLSEARVILSAFRPDLVVLDVELPDGKGFELVSGLQESGISAVFLTGHRLDTLCGLPVVQKGATNALDQIEQRARAGGRA